jgi:hypothetical protein
MSCLSLRMCCVFSNTFVSTLCLIVILRRPLTAGMVWWAMSGEGRGEAAAAQAQRISSRWGVEQVGGSSTEDLEQVDQ